METEEFKEPDLKVDDAKALSAKYLATGGEKEDRAAAEAADGLRQKLNVPDFRTIVKWKTKNRGYSRLDENTEEEVLDALRLALSASCPRSAIAVLTGLNGVAVPVASALMTILKPDDHTVIDFRALETLGYKGGYSTINFYLRYLGYCQKLKDKWGMTLRDLDRALWQSSKDKSAHADQASTIGYAGVPKQ